MTAASFGWLPLVGTKVWLNRPDGRCLGVVVGYVDDASWRGLSEGPRHGQPIIEELNGEVLRVAHPHFLLPMPYGSEAWRVLGRPVPYYAPTTIISV